MLTTHNNTAQHISKLLDTTDGTAKTETEWLEEGKGADMHKFTEVRDFEGER